MFGLIYLVIKDYFTFQASANFRTEMMKFDTELESLKQELVQSATQHRLYP